MKLFSYILAAVYPHIYSSYRGTYLFRGNWNGGGGLDWSSIIYARKHSRRAKAYRRG